MKGVLICGGKGERLFPITKYINKHLLPIYNKPMFFYPLSILLYSGCKEIFIVGNKEDFIFFKKSLRGENIKGYKFHFIVQKKPDGISSAISKVSRFFSNNEKGIFILGDNFFYGNDLISTIIKAYRNEKCSIFLSHAKDPWNYGTIKTSKHKLEFFEKKKTSKGSVITGLYIIDGKSLKQTKNLKKSSRGEYEVIDLIKLIYTNKNLSIVKLRRGIAWYDMGTFKNINRVSNLISIIESRLGLEIGNLN